MIVESKWRNLQIICLYLLLLLPLVVGVVPLIPSSMLAVSSPMRLVYDDILDGNEVRLRISFSFNGFVIIGVFVWLLSKSAVWLLLLQYYYYLFIYIYWVLYEWISIIQRRRKTASNTYTERALTVTPFL
jgi:hypothetical protein